MDKETLSNYGWIVICVLVLAVMLALASPFGTFVADAIKSTTQGLFDVNQNALNSTGLINIDSQEFESCPHDYETTTTGDCATGKTSTHTCKLCGKSYTETTPAGHTWDNTGLTCAECGVAVVKYSFGASDYDRKMGTTTATDANVVIPETFEYDGKTYKVTAIGGNAFKGGTGLTSVTIPKTVKQIGGSAFNGCSNLKEIKYSDAGELTSIESWAFYGCRSLTEIILPEGVQTLGMQAYYACPNVKKVHIPSTLTGHIDGDNFYKSVIVEEITVHPDNPVYHSDGNCIIKTAEKSIVFGCPNTVIPTDGSVTTIGGNRAFAEMNLDGFVIPDAVTCIKKWTFESVRYSSAGITFENVNGWYITDTEGSTSGTNMDVSNPSKNGYNLYQKGNYFWYRAE